MTTTNKSKIPSIRPASVGTRGALPGRAMSPATRATTTPTGTSRLPRRPQSDKPLPSPPIAQVVDPNSPPKASRTLVDAFTPSPTLKEYPVLRPENIPPRLSSKRSSLPTRSPVASRSFVSANGDEGTRVKRLSWHSSGSGSSSGTGPILTISGDADAMILGQRDSIPAVPAIPLVFPERTTQPRSFSALTSRISKATTSRAELTITTASPVPSTKELTANGSPIVKISPIRSMQPPRQPSLDANSPRSPSSVYSTFPDAERSISSVSDRSATPTPEPKSPAPPLRDPPEPPVSSVEVCEELPEEISELTITSESDDLLSVSKVRKTTSTQGDVSPSLGSFDRPGNNVSAPNISTAELSSPSLSRVKRSRDTARTPDSLKPEVSGTARSISIGIPLGCGTPKNRPSRRQPYTPMVSSSSPDDTTPENQNKEALATKVKAKRSILGLFSREKARVKTPETAVPKQGFMGATRSSLAKVMRNSKSLSKVHLPRKTESRSEVRSDRTVNKRSSQTGTFTAPDNGRVSLAQEEVPEKRKNTTEMLHDMVNRIEAGPKDSPERLRHVQIAECIILAAEYTRNASISALEAKKSARDAELHADRAALEFARLNTLLDGAEIDARSMKFIRSLFTNAAAGGPEEETR
ncbi:hypothetical protein J4E82_008246 [Alternaria postmessia]|uniref:uncharacterized protein n=1 Tax=Alternaria postmessia TaxID=1187938 RepID=UPI0022244262|nr:uncharacterized protein J4E82_008246 [Alternaria postmessia]KAI5373054.1 hypothetical protein J4E82_008246 [Alternaria postmessia]